MSTSEQEERQRMTFVAIGLAVAAVVLLALGLNYPELRWLSDLLIVVGCICASGAVATIVVMFWDWRQSHDD